MDRRARRRAGGLRDPEPNDPPIDVIGLARSIGLPSQRVHTLEAFRSALKEAIAGNAPTLIELVIEKDHRSA